LNRAIAVTAPDGSVYRPRFNDAGQLEAVDVNIRGAREQGRRVWSPFVHYINYDAKGQRQVIRYANGAVTAYEYDRTTFRLQRLHTRRASGGRAAAIFKDPETVQDLRFTYDPVGNVTRIEDAALDKVFHDNRRVDAASDYTCDPLYRLLAATGREQVMQSGFSFAPADGDYRDFPFVGAAHLHDLQALGNYAEHYEYDPVGNLMRLRHQASDRNFERNYVYDSPSLLNPDVNNDRLSRTSVQHGPLTLTERYRHDAHGNMTQMPHLPYMAWDFQDRLHETRRQVVNHGCPEATCYVYDTAGQRARKVTLREDGSRRSERYYFGGFEIFRSYRAGRVDLQRETLHVADDTRRIALIETLTIEHGRPSTAAASASRYQFTNQLGSASLELDEAGGLLTYEEYSPYGNSTFQAGDCPEVSAKRYRYTGKERDEENGFTYHGARYYAPWLGRWTACDPSTKAGAAGLYTYANDNPARYFDPNGKWSEDMHFAAVYVAGRLQGASAADAMRAAVASQIMDDYRNLAAPSLKARSVGGGDVENFITSLMTGPGTVNDPLVEEVLDDAGIPKAELTSHLPLARERSWTGYVHEDDTLEMRLANNAHALGVTFDQSREVVRAGIADNNLTEFGLGLHTVGDFLAHANTTGKLTFGHQRGTNEDATDSGPLSGSADETNRNPRKALATFFGFMSLWSEMEHASGPTALTKEQLGLLQTFLTSSDDRMKNYALEGLLKSVGADESELAKFRSARSASVRRQAFEADLTTASGLSGFRKAEAIWLSRANDSFLSSKKIDVSVYTDDPKLPDIAHYQFAKVHNLAPPPHGF
jgi:RHS repeat-associated protein